MAANTANVINGSEPADIRVSNLCKRFDRPSGEPLSVINNLSFSVEQGSLLAIVGPSGCGKSTLLRILSGSEKKTSGEIVYNESRKLRTATIEQAPALLPWRTAFQNACLGAEVRGHLNAVVAKRVQEQFSDFGLGGSEDQFPSQLSGGMQQRVAIVRALQSQPEMLFCDEPFSAIDFVTRLQLNTEFKTLCRLSTYTTVFVTHNIEEAVFLGDKILVLSKRPCQHVKEIRPQQSLFPHDAVKCRKSPEFEGYFNEIWKALT
jgi:NitT/TauT family transport system ATP-binding protein